MNQEPKTQGVEEVVDEMFEMRKKNPRNYDWLVSWLRTKLTEQREAGRREIEDDYKRRIELLVEIFSRFLTTAELHHINEVLDEEAARTEKKPS